MKIGYQVAYVMQEASGMITHNVERFILSDFGGEHETLEECKQLADWSASELKKAAHINPVVVKAVQEGDNTTETERVRIG